jgi:DNA-binding Lrp family transcriptional regulator
MKDTELKLISELMKNSQRSDRELAQAIGVSQPTVTRTKAKLKREGYLLEYTLIPNFEKLGYAIFALTFASIKQTFSPEQAEEARKAALGLAKRSPPNVVLIERGMGIGYGVVIGSFHENYTSYTKLISDLKQSPYLEMNYGSFIIDLKNPIRYRPLTLAKISDHLLTLQKKT